MSDLKFPKEEADKLIESLKGQINPLLEKKANSEAVELIEKAIEELTEKQNAIDIDKFKSTISELEGQIKAIQEKGGSTADTFSLKSMLEDNKEALSSMIEKGGSNLVLKAPATMLNSTNLTGANAGLLPEIEYLQGLKQIAEKDPSIIDTVNLFNTESAQITWSDEANKEGDAEFIAEGALKPLCDFEIQPKLSIAKEVAHVFKVGKNMLKDIKWLESTINGKLRKRIILKLDEKVFNGDEAGSGGTEFDGITQYASAFVAGSLAASVTTPNNSDAVRAAITNITVNSDTDRSFSPNYVFMHPYDVAAMDLSKGTDGNYTLPPFTSADGRMIYGVKVVETTRVAQDFVLVGDMSKSNVGIYEDIEIDFGYENDDFRKNLITMRASARYHHFISANEAVGFVYDQLSVIKAAILKP